MSNSTVVLTPGDTFVAPVSYRARFPGRKMRVIDRMEHESHGVWVDAVPVNPEPSDLFWHSTYRLGAEGRPLPV